MMRYKTSSSVWLEYAVNGGAMGNKPPKEDAKQS